MSSYVININNPIKLKRIAGDMLEIDIEGKKAKVLTEDLAAVVRVELPKDRAAEMFAEIEEKEVSSGKMRVAVRAKTDIKKDEMVFFSVDVTRYLDKSNKQAQKSNPLASPFKGVRTTDYGFIY
jgi:ABC-type amino acid transport substrate-binding protein